MERQLEKWKRKLRGDVKTHEHAPQGRVSEIHHEEGFGRIATAGGGELYFHRNAVVAGDFESMHEGDPVEFVAQTGESEQGPQASTVRRIGPLEYVARTE
jgi:cold shock CspA family protein